MDLFISNILMAVSSGFITSLFASIVIVKNTYRTDFNKICDEIGKNWEKMQDDKIQAQYQQMKEFTERTFKEEKFWRWIGFDKIIIPWIISNDPEPFSKRQFQYLPDNAFKNFINQGHNSRFDNTIIQNLTLFYFYCRAFSEAEQFKEIHNISINPRTNSPEKNLNGLSLPYCMDEVNTAILMINIEYGKYFKKVQDHYNAISPIFQKIHALEINRWLLKGSSV